MQAHVQNGPGLNFGQFKGRHKALAGFVRIGRRADQGHHLVDVVDGDAQAFQNMGPGLGLFQVITGSADDHLAPVVHKAGQGGLEIEQGRSVIQHGQHIDAEAGFQGREFVQGIDHNVWNHPAFEVNDHADALAVRFIAQIRNAVDFAVIDQGRDFFHQAGFVQAVRNFPDDDGLKAFFALFNFHPAAHFHRAAARMVGVVQTFARVDETGSGKIRPLHVFHEVVHAALGIVQQQLERVAEFAQIVRRNVGGHAHGNARRAVEQQVGHLGGHHRGFLQGIVVVGPEIHGILVQVAQKFLGQPGHAHFRVTHGRRRVAVDGTEVALAVHQGIAHGKFLRHAHQGVIDRQIAVRVILTDDVTDDARGFLVRPVVIVGQFVLGEHDSPVHGLQAVAGVRNGAPDDDRKGILQIGLAEFFFYVDLRMLSVLHFRHVGLAGRISTVAAQRATGKITQAPIKNLPHP